MTVSPHSLGITTQLSGARSIIELTACRAGLPLGPAMPKARETPLLSFLFLPPIATLEGHGDVKRGDLINLNRPRIISSWASSYFTVKKRKYPTSISSPWKGGDLAAPSSTTTLLREFKWTEIELNNFGNCSLGLSPNNPGPSAKTFTSSNLHALSMSVLETEGRKRESLWFYEGTW